MRLPAIKNTGKYNRRVITFGGLNMLQSFSEGEMSDCNGISHISFPAITQRRGSEKIFSCNMPTAVVFADKECICANDGLYYDRKKVMELEKGKKTLVFVGSKAIVFPDKVYYDTKSGESGTLSGECVAEGVKVTFSSSTITVPAEYYTTISTVQSTVFSADAKLSCYSTATIENNRIVLDGFSLKPAADMEEGDIFFEKCEKNQYRIVISKEISQSGEEYVIVNDLVTYKNTVENIFATLREGDMVEISGCTAFPDNNKTLKIVSKGENSLVFASESFEAGSEKARISIKRKIPDFTCVCSYNNRLWGCEGNTIYGSALGDPFNFFLYEQLSTDSFSVESNTAGDFTACSVYGSYCLFFKENECYKLYGSKPSNFQLTESFGGGIKKTDALSIANINGKIFYKGSGGIFSFYGGIPQCVSGKIESISMENAVAGSDGKHYYITVDTTDGREEFVYDDEKSLWSKSGICDTLGYAFYQGKIHRLREDGIYELSDSADSNAEWYALLCPFDEKYYKAKNYSRLHITARLFEDSYLCVEVSRDDSPWQCLSRVYGNEKRYVDIPCVLRNCHEVRIRLSGKGKSIIESVTREFSVS